MKRLLLVGALACLAFASIQPSWAGRPTQDTSVTQVSGGFVDGEGKRFAVPPAVKVAAATDNHVISAFPVQLTENAVPTWFWCAHPADMDLASVKSQLLSQNAALLATLPATRERQTSDKKKAPGLPTLKRPPLLRAVRAPSLLNRTLDKCV